MAKLTLENLTKKFGNTKAVDNLNLKVGDKEFIVFVGPSGCGKTTTLRMIAGLESVTDGKIFIGDTQVNDLHPGDRNIAMVFQNYALYPHMTVLENLGFGLKLKKTNPARIESETKRVASLVGIEKLLDRLPKQLSGGERQRVALGRALIRQPQAFLFDEPLSNLDAKLRLSMRGELIRLHRQFETTTVYVTHDQIEAMTLGDRVVVMRDGRIQQVGRPSEIFRKPANIFVAGFVGSPPINFMDAKIESADSALWVTARDFRLQIPATYQSRYKNYIGRKVIFGIRPGDLKASKNMNVKQSLKVTVEVVEFVGHEVILEVARAGLKIVVIEDSYGDFRAGEGAIINFDMDKMYLFEADTGLFIK
ncbi:MAG: ABC transporter ATP-binding protein [Desulfobacterales bacterium]|jgi:multiple sugar transport system ATP-binding protein